MQYDRLTARPVATIRGVGRIKQLLNRWLCRSGRFKLLTEIVEIIVAQY